eukprot:CAMPEP_0174841884 /NCGR_PEP_ID=MMETSP1114-20130205/9592_1 /TAXON_ID=312471 /ORGANISM="Neobodo designis, Strain CCAP 1951/1" /LENGTH=501 /DNA_ID=CAMNT_0016076083 /DNA_START=39 /DNA_END=1544 /DNA_ORIENTATION=+
MSMTREQRARVVLRLTDAEREVFDLLLSALKVSEYTNEVDDLSMYRREEKMKRAMSEVFTTIIGLSHVADTLPKEVLKKLADNTYRMEDIEPTLASAFEIARRYKRINPDKMRSEYGKLAMMLQDLHAYPRIGFDFASIVTPVQTVGAALKRVGALAMLDDDLVAVATRPMPPHATADEVAEKRAARKELVERYGGPAAESREQSPAAASPAEPDADNDADAATSSGKRYKEFGDATRREVVDRCLASLDDAASFIAINVRPIDKLLGYLAEFKTLSSDKWSLQIKSGSGGACLSHSHSQQIGYVREALSLWKEIHENIFDFWETVEHDMILSGKRYIWRNTGQGYARVCGGPETYSRIKRAISTVQQRLGGWVGSQVVHLGDDDVPNPLVFIDKYTIIPNLVGPIVQVLENLDVTFAAEKEPYPGIRKLVLSSVDSHEEIQKLILADFFRHGFDGSGDDGGACIDGRLTSAWNWCSLIEKKKYYLLFKLMGFTGFDANYN